MRRISPASTPPWQARGFLGRNDRRRAGFCRLFSQRSCIASCDSKRTRTVPLPMVAVAQVSCSLRRRHHLSPPFQRFPGRHHFFRHRHHRLCTLLRRLLIFPRLLARADRPVGPPHQPPQRTAKLLQQAAAAAAPGLHLPSSPRRRLSAASPPDRHQLHPRRLCFVLLPLLLMAASAAAVGAPTTTLTAAHGKGWRRSGPMWRSPPASSPRISSCTAAQSRSQWHSGRQSASRC